MWHLLRMQMLKLIFVGTGISVLGMAIMAVVENIFRMSLCKRYPRLAYTDQRIRNLHEAHPLPVHANLGLKEKLAHLDVPGKPDHLAPEDEGSIPQSPKLDH